MAKQLVVSYATQILTNDFQIWFLVSYLITAVPILKHLFQAETKGNYKNELDLDCANGVGAIAAKDFINFVSPQILKINIYSNDIENDQLLNLNCGADFVKVQQRSPESLPPSLLRRCVSFDGDADRVVYYYTERGDEDEKRIFHLLDGDRIATLSKFFDPRL